MFSNHSQWSTPARERDRIAGEHNSLFRVTPLQSQKGHSLSSLQFYLIRNCWEPFQRLLTVKIWSLNNCGVEIVMEGTVSTESKGRPDHHHIFYTVQEF